MSSIKGMCHVYTISVQFLQVNCILFITLIIKMGDMISKSSYRQLTNENEPNTEIAEEAMMIGQQQQNDTHAVNMNQQIDRTASCTVRIGQSMVETIETDQTSSDSVEIVQHVAERHGQCLNSVLSSIEVKPIIHHHFAF